MTDSAERPHVWQAGHSSCTALSNSRPRSSRPSLYSYFDSTIHGWRSWADNVAYDVDWSDPERPALRDLALESAVHAVRR